MPVDTWREGYPYDERLDRATYEPEKRLLQIELITLQSWVKDTGQRLVLLFEAAMPRAKAPRSSGSPRT